VPCSHARPMLSGNGYYYLSSPSAIVASSCRLGLAGAAVWGIASRRCRIELANAERNGSRRGAGSCFSLA
jgi:hypothetical protein